MKKSLSDCPKCGEQLMISEYECSRCHTRVSGKFENTGIFGNLTPGQIELLKTFIVTYGNIGEVAKLLRVSRPTARHRITELGTDMGLTMSEEYNPEARMILDALEKGNISVEEAISKMKK